MRNMIAHGAKRTNPPMSSFESVARIVSSSVLSLSRRSGICIKNRSIADAAPIGRFIKKPGGVSEGLGRGKEEHTPSPAHVLGQHPSDQGTTNNTKLAN
jgi:hypothetical protein